MKQIFLILVAASMVFMFVGSASADLNDGLVDYRPFNGNANDESGNGNDSITTGCSANPLRYCPGSPVIRAQMAVYIVRTFGHQSVNAFSNRQGIQSRIEPTEGGLFVRQIQRSCIIWDYVKKQMLPALSAQTVSMNKKNSKILRLIKED